MSVFIAVFVLAGQHRGQDNQWGRHRRRQPDLIWGVCTGRSQFDNIVYKTEYLSHVELFLPECSILVVSLPFWNDPALMILMIQLSTQEASLKEIENVWTVFQNWKTLFWCPCQYSSQIHMATNSKMSAGSFQAMERVDVEQKMSIRFLHWFCTFCITPRLSSSCWGWHKLHILLHCHADKLSGFLTPVFVIQICFVLLLWVAYSSFIATGQNFMPI